MSKQILLKELVLFDFEQDLYSFYNVNVTSIGYNRVQVTTTEGKIGNKGKEKITYFEGSKTSFKEAMKFAYHHIYEKKNKRYISREKLMKAFRSPRYGKEDKQKKNEPTALVMVDFGKEMFRFYNVELVSVGRNQLQVITSYGKLGAKGREQITRFYHDNNPFKDALHFSRHKTYEKKQEGYVTKAQAARIYQSLIDDRVLVKEEKKAKDAPEKNRIAFGYNCDKCRAVIPPDTFTKIESWAQGEGNWASVPELKEKIYCLDCQIDANIFKKKFPKRTK